MNDVSTIIWQVLMYCPFIVLMLVYFVLKKLKLKQQYVVGLSADTTTLLLFLSVPFIANIAWGFNLYIIIIIVAIVIALILTFIEWRTKKEIEIPKLMRKIWRVYFVALMISYVGVGVAALITLLVQNL